MAALKSLMNPIFKWQNFEIDQILVKNPKFVLALELKVLRLWGSFLGIWPSIYVLKGWYIETPQKVSITVTFGEQVVSPPPTRISNSERPPGEGLKSSTNMYCFSVLAGTWPRVVSPALLSCVQWAQATCYSTRLVLLTMRKHRNQGE